MSVLDRLFAPEPFEQMPGQTSMIELPEPIAWKVTYRQLCGVVTEPREWRTGELYPFALSAAQAAALIEQGHPDCEVLMVEPEIEPEIRIIGWAEIRA